MRIMKAYSGLGNELPSPGMPLGSNGERQKNEPRKMSPGGDTINLSAEAREALAGGEVPLSAQAADATYDQYGNVTRQFDSLQGELRNLASSLMSTGEGSAISGRVNMLQTQLRSLEAMV